MNTGIVLAMWEDTRPCPCDGCENRDKCATEFLACRDFRSYAHTSLDKEIRPRNYKPPRHEIYRALFPRDKNNKTNEQLAIERAVAKEEKKEIVLKGGTIKCWSCQQVLHPKRILKLNLCGAKKCIAKRNSFIVRRKRRRL